MENWQSEYLAAKCRMTLEARGIQVHLVHDFSEALSLMGRLGKTPSSILDPNKNVFTRRNSLWMFALHNGRPVIGGGVRVDDLGEEYLCDFLERTLPLTFSVQPEPADFPVFDGRISGRVAYFGDLVADTKLGLSKSGKEAIRLFTAYGHHRVFVDLDVDCTYCFLRACDWRRASNYGFLDTDPFVWNTNKMMYPDGNPEWIAHLRRKRLPSLFKSVSGLLLQPFAEDQEFFFTGERANPTRNANKRQANVQCA